MERNQNVFELNYREGKIRVARHTLGNGQIVYQVVFSNGWPTLVLTRATLKEGDRFWTSIPEGRQREANEVGPVIEAYIKSLQ